MYTRVNVRARESRVINSKKKKKMTPFLYLWPFCHYDVAAVITTVLNGATRVLQRDNNNCEYGTY